MSKYQSNRVRQAPCGTWYFKFKFGGESYYQANFDTQEQANEALYLQYKSLNLTTTGQPKQPKPSQTKSPSSYSFASKADKAAKAAQSRCNLNRAIAELNNATRVFVEKATPTIAELSRIAKQQPNPRQFYLEQLKAGAYRV